MFGILKWVTGGGWQVIGVGIAVAAGAYLWFDYQSLRTDKVRLETTVLQLQTTLQEQQALREQLASLSTITDTITAQLQRQSAEQTEALAAGLKTVRSGILKDAQTKNLCVVPQSMLSALEWMRSSAGNRPDHATGNAGTPSVAPGDRPGTSAAQPAR